MSRVFWDTNLFVYLLEGNSDLTELVIALRNRMIERQDELLTSAMTLGEVLVRPKEVGNEDLVELYEMNIRSGATVLPFDERTARVFAEIRTDRTIRAPDAIQLACASIADTDLFITNDIRLSRKNIHGIRFIQSLEQADLEQADL